jgi:hypothetical protein
MSHLTAKQTTRILEQLIDGLCALPESYATAKAADAKITDPSRGPQPLRGDGKLTEVQLLTNKLLDCTQLKTSAWQQLLDAQVWLWAGAFCVWAWVCVRAGGGVHVQQQHA